MLRQEIEKHNYNYYVLNRPSITDEQYDNLYDQLFKFEKENPNLISPNSPTQKVGYITMSKLEKTKHEIPLLSLDKTKSIEGLKKFIGNKNSVASIKADGLTTEIIYNNGRLIEASTRGDGVEGEIITHNVKVFKNVPKRIDFKEILKISGESLIFSDDFDRINEKLAEDEKYSTCRNLAAGSCRQLDNKICASRSVYFFAFNILKIDGMKFKTKYEQMRWLETLGIDIVPIVEISQIPMDEVIKYLKELAVHIRMPLDGIVISYNDIEYSKTLGRTAKFYKDSIAYKFEDERVITNYITTEWNTTRTGKINPIAIFNPVIIDGTKVERASLFNLDIFENLQLGKGDKISTYKANMIIPQIDENFTKSNMESIPNKCPTCGHPTEIRMQKTARFLYCTNDNCMAKNVDKVVHFSSRKAMNIEGLSEATIEKFINKGFIKDFVDIFKLERYKNQIINMDGFGRRSYEKLIEAIDKVRNIELYRLIYGLGIEQVGESGSKNLCKYFNNNVEEIINAHYLKLTQVKDFGDITAGNVYDYFNHPGNKNKQIFKELLKHINIKSNNVNNNGNKLNGLTFVITGTLSKSRDEFKNIIEGQGGSVTGSISKKTNYLLAGDNIGETKIKKAVEYGVKIIDENDLNLII